MKILLLCPLFQIFSLERYGIGFSFSNIMEESHFLLSTYIMLTFDSVLYMLLAVYFDKVLQGKCGLCLQLYFPPFYFWIIWILCDSSSQKRWASPLPASTKIDFGLKKKILHPWGTFLSLRCSGNSQIKGNEVFSILFSLLFLLRLSLNCSWEK